MFSSILPNYEVNLKNELYGCFKHIGIPFDVLEKMPIRDRKYFISLHNGDMNKKNNKKRNGEHRTSEIGKFTDLSQSNARHGTSGVG
jgi:hypothetical protein